MMWSIEKSRLLGMNTGRLCSGVFTHRRAPAIRATAEGHAHPHRLSVEQVPDGSGFCPVPSGPLPFHASSIRDPFRLDYLSKECGYQTCDVVTTSHGVIQGISGSAEYSVDWNVRSPNTAKLAEAAATGRQPFYSFWGKEREMVGRTPSLIQP